MPSSLSPPPKLLPHAGNQCFTFIKNRKGSEEGADCAPPPFLQGKEVPSPSHDVQGEQGGWLQALERTEEGGGRRQVLQYRGSPQTTKFLLSSRDPLILLCTVTAWREGRYDLPLPGEERGSSSARPGRIARLGRGKEDRQHLFWGTPSELLPHTAGSRCIPCGRLLKFVSCLCYKTVRGTASLQAITESHGA